MKTDFLSFLSKVCGITLVCALILIGIQSVLGSLIRDENVYVAASIDKQKRLSDVNEPKVVFVGGSNLTFGLDCKRLTDSLKMPFVNMAVHGGTGLRYMLNEAKDGVKKGDVVILSLEYYLGIDGDRKLISQLIDVNPRARKYVLESVADQIKFWFFDVQRCVSSMFFRVLTGQVPTIYLRSNFSEEGDMVGHFDQPSVFQPAQRGKMAQITYNVEIKAINAFVGFVEQQGAKVHFVFPCYPHTNYEKDIDAISHFEKLMRENIKCKILNDPKSAVMEDRYFFDTAYHLTKEGRSIRTENILNLLKNR
jgi:hypothetical protein